jgi:bacterioferritin-associated ferredoxin
MDLDHKLCYCYHVSKRKIVNFIRQTRPRRASQVSECFGAGSGCGWCVPFLVRLHRQIMGGEVVEPDSITPEEYERLRGGYLSGIQEGTRTRNSYAEAEARREPVGHEALDYTRYFSRERPEPPPEVLAEEDAGTKEEES